MALQNSRNIEKKNKFKKIQLRKKLKIFKSIINYGPCLYKVLRKIHPRLILSAKTINVLNSFGNDIFERIAKEASCLAKINNRKKISTREIQSAVCLVLPPGLAQEATAFGKGAVLKYLESKKETKPKGTIRMAEEIKKETWIKGFSKSKNMVYYWNIHTRESFWEGECERLLKDPNVILMDKTKEMLNGKSTFTDDETVLKSDCQLQSLEARLKKEFDKNKKMNSANNCETITKPIVSHRSHIEPKLQVAPGGKKNSDEEDEDEQLNLSLSVFYENSKSSPQSSEGSNGMPRPSQEIVNNDTKKKNLKSFKIPKLKVDSSSDRDSGRGSQTDSQLLTSSPTPQLYSTTTQVCNGKPHRPQRTTQVSNREPQLPQRMTQMPNREPQLPQRMTQMPNREPQLPQRMTQMPNREPQLPQRMTQMPNREPQLPQRMTQMPNREPQLPQRTTQVPNREPQLPQRTTQVPNRETQLPQSKTQIQQETTREYRRGSQINCKEPYGPNQLPQNMPSQEHLISQNANIVQPPRPNGDWVKQVWDLPPPVLLEGSSLPPAHVPAHVPVPQQPLPAAPHYPAPLYDNRNVPASFNNPLPYPQLVTRRVRCGNSPAASTSTNTITSSPVPQYVMSQSNSAVSEQAHDEETKKRMSGLGRANESIVNQTPVSLLSLPLPVRTVRCGSSQESNKTKVNVTKVQEARNLTTPSQNVVQATRDESLDEDENKTKLNPFTDIPSISKKTRKKIDIYDDSDSDNSGIPSISKKKMKKIEICEDIDSDDSDDSNFKRKKGSMETLIKSKFATSTPSNRITFGNTSRFSSSIGQQSSGQTTFKFDSSSSTTITGRQSSGTVTGPTRCSLASASEFSPSFTRLSSRTPAVTRLTSETSTLSSTNGPSQLPSESLSLAVRPRQMSSQSSASGPSRLSSKSTSSAGRPSQVSGHDPTQSLANRPSQLSSEPSLSTVKPPGLSGDSPTQPSTVRSSRLSSEALPMSPVTGVPSVSRLSSSIGPTFDARQVLQRRRAMQREEQSKAHCFKQNDDSMEWEDVESNQERLGQHSSLVQVQHDTAQMMGSLPFKPLIVVCDTNALIHDMNLVEDLIGGTILGIPVKVVIPYQVFRELDGMKEHSSQEVMMGARAAIRLVGEFTHADDSSKFKLMIQNHTMHRKKAKADFDLEKNDDYVLNCALQQKEINKSEKIVILLTGDKHLLSHAAMMEVNSQCPSSFKRWVRNYKEKIRLQAMGRDVGNPEACFNTALTGDGDSSGTEMKMDVDADPLLASDSYESFSSGCFQTETSVVVDRDIKFYADSLTDDLLQFLKSVINKCNERVYENLNSYASQPRQNWTLVKCLGEVVRRWGTITDNNRLSPTMNCNIRRIIELVKKYNKGKEEFTKEEMREYFTCSQILVKEFVGLYSQDSNLFLTRLNEVVEEWEQKSQSRVGSVLDEDDPQPADVALQNIYNCMRSDFDKWKEIIQQGIKSEKKINEEKLKSFYNKVSHIRHIIKVALEDHSPVDLSAKDQCIIDFLKATTLFVAEDGNFLTFDLTKENILTLFKDNDMRKGVKSMLDNFRTLQSDVNDLIEDLSSSDSDCDFESAFS